MLTSKPWLEPNWLATKQQLNAETAATVEHYHRRMARRNFLDFVMYTMPAYQINWHHQYMAEKIQAFAEKKIRRLMIFVPPRYGKSELVSRRLPAFLFGLNPKNRLIASSYGQDLASAMNRDVQRIIDGAAYKRLFPDTELYGKNIRTVAYGTWLRNSSEFEIVNHGGHYRSAGIGQGITGMGFDYGLIDDPIKDAATAHSPRERQNQWDWYTTTFRTRAEKNACILIVLTRWHDDDLVGRLLELAKSEPDADQWEIITLPALCEEPGVTGDNRQVGEALWKDKYTLEELNATRAGMSPYDWSALYQQNPAPSEGGIFKREYFRYFQIEQTPEETSFVVPERAGMPTTRILANQCRWFQTCDTALKETQMAAYTAVCTWALTPQRWLLLYHVWRERLEVPKQFKALLRLRDGPLFGLAHDEFGFLTPAAEKWPMPLMFQAVESQASGIGILQQGAAEGKPFKELRADGDKVMRSGPIATLYGNGQVYHRAGAPWAPAYEHELLRFPSGVFKDMADCAGYAGILATQDQMLTLGWDQPLLTSASTPYSPDDRQPRIVYETDTLQVIRIGDLEVTFDDFDRNDPWR